ncbi:hypothetical protein N9740_09095 [Pseudomonadales bacterium]|nr:hypothetical protein [Pseudomonadales bacterium]MDA9366770.1 hypothetical protein [Pseudomonadales bacterium]MDB4151628.1 hypothetical protein [Pseudomonadales bacterium]MDC0174703.1 hypothetical protein [Pseudomonadales bacterium]MDC1307360.1 hypothetical protein [Pseudomonadales bacterium]
MSKRKAAVSEDGVGLSFLDVLCCGLGAAILLLLIVKHEQPSVNSEVLDLMASSEVGKLQSEVERLSSERTNLEFELEALAADKIQLTEAARVRGQYLTNKEASVQKVKAALSTELARMKGLKEFDNQLARQLTQEQESRSELDLKGAGALDGINFSGLDKVVILLDVSASMLHWSLVEIFRIQVSGSVARNSAPKWNQARLSAQFAYKTIDRNARFKLLMYSEEVYNLEGNSIGQEVLIWDKKDGRHDALVEDLVSHGPKRGTNLKKAIDAANSLIPKPGRILLITDGLPGKVDGRGKLKGCPKEQQKVSTLTSDCRVSVAMKSVEAMAGGLSGVPVDVVLLPLDGDSEAIRFYSIVSGVTAGKLITPAVDWLLK